NLGLNMMALHHLLPAAQLSAIEINKSAADELRKLEYVTVYQQSIYEFEVSKTFDLALVMGVMIHQEPEKLPEFYDRVYQSTDRYICLNEYYNPTPVEVPYRGHKGQLFKRDFAGELLDRFKDLQLVDYGFQYHRDPNFPADDGNWFLLEKR